MDERIDLYKRLLLAWNKKINLIGPEARENLDAHVEEALAAAQILEPAGEVLDFGSGGGLPAIPMAIVCPAARFHLVEADKKKWAFLKHVVRECALNSVVYDDRLVDALKRLPTELRFSLVISRAVGNPEEWVPLLRPWIAPGGRFSLFQGSPSAPKIAGVSDVKADRLPRGTANYLVTFHVEQR
jgi:16S rRNA (guanine527-N7)-methyltransferase